MEQRLGALDDGLLSCDREPIHLLGAIQPTGFLLSVNADWLIVRASENVRAYLGIDHADLLGRPLVDTISSSVVHDIRGCFQLTSEAGVVGRLFGQCLAPDGPSFDIAVHRFGREFVLEFERSEGGGEGSLSILRAMIAGVERQNSAQALLREAARHIRAFTGFDRVMIYRFDEDGSGEVVAEAATASLTPFLGLRFPASDIPVQARALYERNYLRTIVDVDAVPVAVMPALSPEGEALDLSMSMLRSVSPTHIEYLKNMGVRSSMSISILRGGRLWGLIACHHGKPNRITFEMRSTAELFGQMFSYLLEEHLREDEVTIDSVAKQIHDRVAVAFAGPGAILDNIGEFLAGVVDYIPSDGLGIFVAGRVALSGLTPTRDEFLELVGFLNQTASGTTFSTHGLGDAFAPAARYRARAAGILSLPIGRHRRDYLVFFRREIIKTVTWAGQPLKVETATANGLRLMPRKSFEAWEEMVKGQSAPWRKNEIRAAESLRGTLVELALQTSETAHVDRMGAGQRQEVLIAELNHRNRNVLGLVRGLITQSAASAPDVSALVESLDDRILSLASAQDILTSTGWKPASLHALVRAEISTYSQSDEDLIMIGPDVMLQPQAYSAMAMVIHELVTNARKHGALTSVRGRITVMTMKDETNDIAFSWRESGGPPVTPPTRRGFGSTILEQAIPFEVGGLSKPNYARDGFELDVKLPAAVARCVVGATAPAATPAPRVDDDDQLDALALEALALAGLLRTTLVVEDNLFIAVDAEDMLRRLGAGTIEIVKTVAEALDALTERDFSFALLDVNLGVETSLPVALALKSRMIPFVFGTGYGETLGMPATLEDAPIVLKPYSRQAMRAALLRLAAALAPSSSEGGETGEVDDGRRLFIAGSEGAGALRLDPPIFSGIESRETEAPPRGTVVLMPKKQSGLEVFARPFEPRDAMSDRPTAFATRQNANPFVRKLTNLLPLSMDEQAIVGRLCGPARAVEPGTDLIREGDVPSGLFVVLDGFACRYKLRLDGSRQITSYLVPGDFCDLSSVIGRMTSSVGTVSACRIAETSRELVREVKISHPRIAQAFQQSAYVDEAILREWLLNMGRRSAEERFAHLFCELFTRMEDVGMAKANEFKLPLTQFDFGDTMGLSYVHVNRTLQSLRQQDLISLKGRVLIILDLPRLKRRAEFKADYLHVGRSIEEDVMN